MSKYLITISLKVILSTESITNKAPTFCQSSLTWKRLYVELVTLLMCESCLYSCFYKQEMAVKKPNSTNLTFDLSLTLKYKTKPDVPFTTTENLIYANKCHCIEHRYPWKFLINNLCRHKNLRFFPKCIHVCENCTELSYCIDKLLHYIYFQFQKRKITSKGSL